jgi:hypothetical protein
MNKLCPTWFIRSEDCRRFQKYACRLLVTRCIRVESIDVADLSARRNQSLVHRLKRLLPNYTTGGDRDETPASKAPCTPPVRGTEVPQR